MYEVLPEGLWSLVSYGLYFHAHLVGILRNVRSLTSRIDLMGDIKKSKKILVNLCYAIERDCESHALQGLLNP